MAAPQIPYDLYVLILSLRSSLEKHLFKIKTLYVWPILLSCTTGVPSALGGQKRAQGPLGVKLKMAVNYQVGAGSSERAAGVFNH